jgi:hypothetical protein
MATAKNRLALQTFFEKWLISACYMPCAKKRFISMKTVTRKVRGAVHIGPKIRFGEIDS